MRNPEAVHHAATHPPLQCAPPNHSCFSAVLWARCQRPEVLIRHLYTAKHCRPATCATYAWRYAWRSPT